MLQYIIKSGGEKDLAVGEVANAIEQLRKISPYFPNVNPFGIEKPDFKGLASSFEKAVQEVRPSLRRILDMQKTSEVAKAVIPSIIDNLKAFSESIFNIFNVKSKYEELNKPEEKASETTEEEDAEVIPTDAELDKPTSWFENIILNLLSKTTSRTNKSNAAKKIQDKIKKSPETQEDALKIIKDDSIYTNPDATPLKDLSLSLKLGQEEPDIPEYEQIPLDVQKDVLFKLRVTNFLEDFDEDQKGVLIKFKNLLKDKKQGIEEA